MKKLLLLIVTLCSMTVLSAQDIVTLTVNGQGATKEAASANALRSAIEQAFGVFVSANTEILNDDLVKDEIATVSSGNIQKYSEISCVNMPNGEVSVTLSATVAIKQLVAYAQSKGSKAEFAGQTFAMNMKIRELNKQNEIKALQHAQLQLRIIAEHMFNWNLVVGDPYILGDGYGVKMTVTAASNEASDAFYNTFFGTLNSLSLKPSEISEYKNTNNQIYKIRVQSYDERPASASSSQGSSGSLGSLSSSTEQEAYGLDSWGNSNSFKKVYSFRSEYIYDFIEDVHYILRAASIGFRIRESNDTVESFTFNYDKFPPCEYPTEGRERGLYIKAAYAIYDLRRGGYHASSYTGGSEYVTYDRSLDVLGLSKYTVKVKKSKKSPDPTIYAKDVFSHTFEYTIPKDKISSIMGFEAVHEPKGRADVE